MTDRGANTSLCFLLSFLVSKLTQQNLVRILGEIFDKNFTFHCVQLMLYHIWHMQHIRHYLDLDLAQNYLQMRLCQAYAIVAINFVRYCRH